MNRKKIINILCGLSILLTGFFIGSTYENIKFQKKLDRIENHLRDAIERNNIIIDKFE